MQFIYLLEVPVVGVAGLLLLLDLLDRGRRLTPTFWSALSAIAALAVLASSFHASGPDGPTFWNSYIGDGYGLLDKRLLLSAVFLTSLLSYDFVSTRTRWVAEYYALLWFAVFGMMLMVSANELIMLFVATETTTVSLYILAAFFKDERPSVEAGLKYLLLGAAFAATMLYGMALIYGATGTQSIPDIAVRLGRAGTISPMLLTGMVLLLVGFSFKLAAVPFHSWAPDVYQGAPTPITAFLSVASKAAGVAVLLRVFYIALGPLQADWTVLLMVLAAITMIVGNVVALTQRDIKRLLAYSSISQAGYILVGASSASTLGISSSLFYLVTYLFANFLAFTVVVVVYGKTGSDDTFDYGGLGRRSPLLALAMMLALLSLGGIPPLAGFFGKLYLFAAAVEQGHYFLVLIGILTSTVAIFYYLTVLRRLYIDEPKPDAAGPVPLGPSSRLALLICLAGTLLLGVLPHLAADWTLQVGRELLAGQ